jgi:hypothetical protein
MNESIEYSRQIFKELSGCVAKVNNISDRYYDDVKACDPVYILFEPLLVLIKAHLKLIEYYMRLYDSKKV